MMPPPSAPLGAPAPPSIGELAQRLAALEQKVKTLEIGQAAPDNAAPPKGRAAAASKKAMISLHVHP